MTSSLVRRIAQGALLSLLSVGIPSVVAAPTWSNYMYLTTIEVSNGALYLAHPDLSACNGFAAIGLVDGNGSREMYSMALAAFMTGRPVRLLLDGCAGYYVLKGVTY